MIPVNMNALLFPVFLTRHPLTAVQAGGRDGDWRENVGSKGHAKPPRLEIRHTEASRTAVEFRRLSGLAGRTHHPPRFQGLSLSRLRPPSLSSAPLPRPASP